MVGSATGSSECPSRGQPLLGHPLKKVPTAAQGPMKRIRQPLQDLEMSWVRAGVLAVSPKKTQHFRWFSPIRVRDVSYILNTINIVKNITTKYIALIL
jgi:hypothetical protein